MPIVSWIVTTTMPTVSEMRVPWTMPLATSRPS